MEAWLQQFPLRASGRNIVNKHGERFKLSGVNWYGASDSYHVVGGLEMRSLQDICETVASMGFTVVRLPFSNEMLRVPEVPEGAINYELNPQLKGLSPLEVHDQVVHELGKVHVAVVLNNHTIIGMWSGGVEANGLWYLEGSDEYTEAAWIEDWLTMVARYRHQPHVVAYDIRNEVRPTAFLSAESRPSWGGGGCCDWARAAGTCAKALIRNGGDGLIIVERICWPQEGLREMLSPPPWERWSVPRDRIVLSLHMYAWSGPGHWSPKHFTNSVVHSILHAVDYARNSALYGEFEEKELFEILDREFGFCLDEAICPVWLSEFGADLKREGEVRWFERMCCYLKEKDVDFAYWPLNVGYKPATVEDEAYGILTDDWKPRWADSRLQSMRRLMQSASPASLNRQRSRGLSIMGYPLTPSAKVRSRGQTLDFSFSATPSMPSTALTPSDCEALRERLLTISPIYACRTARGEPFQGSREDWPMALSLHPWCHPLPGPLLSWPDEPITEAPHIPLPRYMWTVLHGKDADPGNDAQILGGSVDELKRACVEGGFGAFVLFEGRGYMRNMSAEYLLTKLVPNPKSVIFLAQEVRLCAVWTLFEAEVLMENHYKVVASEDTPFVLVTADNEDELMHECQQACLERECMAFEICSDEPCSARLFRHEELNVAPVDGTLQDFLEEAGYSFSSSSGVGSQSVEGAGYNTRRKASSELSILKQLYVLESSLVRIGLEAHPDMDAFPGNNIWVSDNTSLVECRELCLRNHYGGFAIHKGKAYFRTSTDATLRKHLRSGFPDTVFYIITARELQEEDLPAGFPMQPCQTKNNIASCVKSRMTETLLPHLWQPNNRRRTRLESAARNGKTDGSQPEYTETRQFLL